MALKYVWMILLLPTIAHASISADNSWKKGITLTIGPAWSHPGNTQNISFIPSFSQTYVNQSGTLTFTNGELFLHLQKSFYTNIKTQLGIALAATSPIYLKGDIWQDNDPDFNNLEYAYKIGHTQIGLRAKLIKDLHTWAEPYVSASVGIGFNRAYNYHNTTKLPEVIPDGNFTSHTNAVFSYTLDVGIHKELSEHCALEVGYEFADWGKTSLGRALGQTTGNGLTINHVYSSALQIGLNLTA